MANPPIVIPPFNNVPAPGSPIKSDWPQQITNYVIAAQALANARASGIPGGGSAGTTGLQGLGVGNAILGGTTVTWTVTGASRHTFLIGQLMVEQGGNPTATTILQIGASFGDPLVTAQQTVVQNGWGQVLVFRYIAVAAGTHSAYLKGAVSAGFANARDRSLIVLDMGG